MTIYMYIASAAWILIVTGYLNRSTRSRHVPLVLSGIILDLLLVVYLQLTRDAVETALSLEVSLLGGIHIICSSLAGILYFPLFYTGILLISHNESPAIRKTHRLLGTTALLFRTLGFLFMFSFIKVN